MFPEALQRRVADPGVVAVLILERAEDAAPLARALLRGGVGVMEMTLRTPAALDALRAVREGAPGMCVGAGTVLTPGQVGEVKEAGASFAVAPGTNPRVLAAAREAGLPFAPGIATPSDVEAALEFGCRLLKFFPAETSGGLAHLKGMAAPYQHLGVRFIPLGGLDEANFTAYLREPLIAAVGGSWLAPKAAVAARDWGAIEERAARASRLAREARQGGGGR